MGGFHQTLDQTYAKLRDRAAMEWARRISEAKDPSDACVNVRIAIPIRLSHDPLAGPRHLANPVPLIKAQSGK